RRMRAAILVPRGGFAAAALLAVACHGGGASSTGATTGTGTSADTSTSAGSSSETGEHVPAVYRIDFDDASGTVSLLRDEEPLVRFAADGFQLGLVEMIDDTRSYDPAYELAVEWLAPDSVTRGDGGVLTLALAYSDGSTATLRFDEVASGRFAATLVPGDGGRIAAAFRLRARIDASEGFYGLGEWFDTPQHRGRARPMQLEGDLTFEGGSNEAHVPVPLLVGTRGWGLFVKDDHPGLFECASEEDDLVQVTFGVGADGDAGLAFELYGAEHPLDVTAHYWASTGAPVEPAPWALGPWLWRNENEDAAQVSSDANMIRDLDLATSAIWIDRPYATGVNTFDFEPTRFADPAAMIDELHDLGFRVALWHTPYVSTMDEPATALAMEAELAGYYPPTTGLLVNAWGAPPIDFTNVDAESWWFALLGDYRELGIEGYKLDYGEDVLTGVAGGRVPWAFADGRDERTMHAGYPRVYHQPYADSLPESGGFILARGGAWGDQTRASVIWPGDLDADMSRFGDDRDGKKGVGGLPSALSASLSLGPSGYPLFASDTGGYRDSPPTKETFVRWFEHTALTPVMQIGTASSTVAWEFAENPGFDEELLGWYRDYTRLHLRLFPYLWTHVRAADRPIQRALGLAYPELGVHPADVYLLGDDLLVAPVIEVGATSRTLNVPPGRWIDWWDGTAIEGPIETTVDAPLGKLPLWIRAGGIVPMLRPTIDSLSPTGQPDRVDSYATTPGVLWPRLVADVSASTTLFDGTAIVVLPDDSSTHITVTPGDAFALGMVIEVMDVPVPPSEVRIDDAPLAMGTDIGALAQTPGWLHTADRGGTLWIGVPTGMHVAMIVP
ncbi:MAG TPA: TIM-barrel domain-containing protein, partial [Nannocystaceae bacterium]|nr:TIM-barrel domain-containing protein [Nannocystaceae bacterium]